MSQAEIKKLIDLRIQHLSKDLEKIPKGVESIVIKHIIDELKYLTWSIDNPNQETYSSFGFRFKGF